MSITAPRPANPSVTTGEATGVTTDSATLDGTLHSLGAVDDGEVYFVFGESETNIDEPSSKTTVTEFDALSEDFSAEMTGLDPDTEYAFRAVVDAADDDSSVGNLRTVTTPSERAVPATASGRPPRRTSGNGFVLVRSTGSHVVAPHRSPARKPTGAR